MVDQQRFGAAMHVATAQRAAGAAEIVVAIDGVATARVCVCVARSDATAGVLNGTRLLRSRSDWWVVLGGSCRESEARPVPITGIG